MTPSGDDVISDETDGSTHTIEQEVKNANGVVVTQSAPKGPDTPMVSSTTDDPTTSDAPVVPATVVSSTVSNAPPS